MSTPLVNAAIAHHAAAPWLQVKARTTIEIYTFAGAQLVIFLEPTLSLASRQTESRRHLRLAVRVIDVSDRMDGTAHTAAYSNAVHATIGYRTGVVWTTTIILAGALTHLICYQGVPVASHNLLPAGWSGGGGAWRGDSAWLHVTN